jgi:hypothetical protein
LPFVNEYSPLVEEAVERACRGSGDVVVDEQACPLMIGVVDMVVVLSDCVERRRACEMKNDKSDGVVTVVLREVGTFAVRQCRGLLPQWHFVNSLSIFSFALPRQVQRGSILN